MSNYYAFVEPTEYVIRWRNGKVETIRAHAVNMPTRGDTLGRDSLVTVYAETDGRWTLLLAVSADEIESIRNVERQPAPAAIQPPPAGTGQDGPDQDEREQG
jgi:hypothetical protein